MTIAHADYSLPINKELKKPAYAYHVQFARSAKVTRWGRKKLSAVMLAVGMAASSPLLISGARAINDHIEDSYRVQAFNYCVTVKEDPRGELDCSKILGRDILSSTNDDGTKQPVEVLSKKTP